MMINDDQSHRLHGAGMFTYIWVMFRANVGKYSIHGAYGNGNDSNFGNQNRPYFCCSFPFCETSIFPSAYPWTLSPRFPSWVPAATAPKMAVEMNTTKWVLSLFGSFWMRWTEIQHHSTRLSDCWPIPLILSFILTGKSKPTFSDWTPEGLESHHVICCPHVCCRLQ